MAGSGGDRAGLRTAGEALIAGFATTALATLAVATFRVPPPVEPPPKIEMAGLALDWSDWRVLAGLAVIALVIVVSLVLRSRARFFIVATGIVGGEVGILSFDILRFSGAFPQGSWLFEAVRTPSAR